MAYDQGTVVIVTTTVTDPDTGDPVDPSDFQATIWPPDSDPLPVMSWVQESGVVQLSTGVFRFLLDTSASAGDWFYAVATTGQMAVVKKRRVRVV